MVLLLSLSVNRRQQQPPADETFLQTGMHFALAIKLFSVCARGKLPTRHTTNRLIARQRLLTSHAAAAFAPRCRPGHGACVGMYRGDLWVLNFPSQGWCSSQGLLQASR
jgi:hypothetical protein